MTSLVKQKQNTNTSPETIALEAHGLSFFVHAMDSMM